MTQRSKAQLLFCKYDADGSGTINFAEFRQLCYDLVRNTPVCALGYTCSASHLSMCPSAVFGTTHSTEPSVMALQPLEIQQLTLLSSKMLQ